MATSRPPCASTGCDRHLPRRGARFCSRGCYLAVARTKPSRPDPIPGCEFCGGPKPRRDRPYCRRGCGTSARQRPQPPCRLCGVPTQRRDRPFCSLVCSRMWQREHPSRPWAGVPRLEIRGDQHPRWKGHEASPAAKRRRLRHLYPKVRRCGICWLPGVRRARDGDPGNTSPGNVVWRCRTCLSRFHRKRRFKRQSISRC